MTEWKKILKAGWKDKGDSFEYAGSLKELMEEIQEGIWEMKLEQEESDESLNLEIERENEVYLERGGEPKIKSAYAEISYEEGFRGKGSVRVRATMMDGYILPVMELMFNSDEHLNRIAEMLSSIDARLPEINIKGIERLFIN